MDEALLVRSVERLGDLREEVDGALRVERARFGDELREVVALDVAHREKEKTILVSGLIDGDDVRWSSEAAIRDSRKKRSLKRSSCASSGAITFNATLRPRPSSEAR